MVAPTALGATTPAVLGSAVPGSRMLFWSLLPMVVVITSCVAGMVPSGYRSFVKYRDSSSPRRKLHRRVFTGCMLGAVVSTWIFSGTYAFLSVFALMAVVAQNEYYSMARQNGCFPTWKLGTLGSLAMYISGAMQMRAVHDAMLPLTGCICIVYLLLRQEKNTPPTTMNDVSTTFMGIWYLGYMPSFWVRLRVLDQLPLSQVLPLFLPAALLAKLPVAAIDPSMMGPDLFSKGAIVQWWTMISIVAADICAYFGGKRWGRTKLISVSPNKTLEGFVAGVAGSVAMMLVGATLMRWPLPLVSGALYGAMCAVMGLIGDLTVSLMKRSSGVKDTGDLLPGHGGLLDRIDSFLLVSAPAYFFVRYFLPVLSGLAHG